MAEYEAARMPGDAPDTEEKLGAACDVPEDFAANRQAAISQQVLAVPGSDTRPPDLTSRSIEN